MTSKQLPRAQQSRMRAPNHSKSMLLMVFHCCQPTMHGSRCIIVTGRSWHRQSDLEDGRHLYRVWAIIRHPAIKKTAGSDPNRCEFDLTRTQPGSSNGSVSQSPFSTPLVRLVRNSGTNRALLVIRSSSWLLDESSARLEYAMLMLAFPVELTNASLAPSVSHSKSSQQNKPDRCSERG